jgi:hypothetical protein
MDPTPGTEIGVTPDGQVADEIVEELVSEGLILATQVGQIFRGLESGNLKMKDWRLIAEKALEAEGSDGRTPH